MTWQILTGDCIEQMRTLDDESVNCCVTSPPYWGLRDYGVDGQLGLEETPEQFVAKMVDVFAEVRRVLRADGTLWLNIGDSYNAGASTRREPARESYGKHDWMGGSTVRAHTPDLKPKDLVGIPWMLAFALRADGWYLRRDIIWAKPNPMPESVTDRPTSSHEYLFLLTKSPRYFYDAEAIREQATYAQKRPAGWANEGRHEAVDHNRRDKQRGHGRRHDGFNDRWDAMSKEEQQALGRNKRSVWTIATKPFPDAHFATFPPDLVEPCIKAATSSKVCGQCGAPWRRLLEVEPNPGGISGNVGVAYSKGTPETTIGNGEKIAGRHVYRRAVDRGWEATCGHADDSGTAVVLDPFAGAATTGLVATQLGRDFVGIELNPEYVTLGEQRIRRWEADPAGQLRRAAVSIDAAQIGLELDLA